MRNIKPWLAPRYDLKAGDYIQSNRVRVREVKNGEVYTVHVVDEERRVEDTGQLIVMDNEREAEVLSIIKGVGVEVTPTTKIYEVFFN